MLQGIPRAALVTQVHDGIDAVKQMRILAAIGVNEVCHSDVIDMFTALILRLHVNEYHLIAISKRGQKLVGNIAGRTSHQDSVNHVFVFLYERVRSKRYPP